jgi:DNA-binding CsgD family transcriptional regulator
VVSAAFEAAGLVLSAAAAAAAASTGWSRRADRRRADASAVRAKALAARTEGAQTPALVALRAPVPLTGRERDVALLAAQGLSSKAIAERLFLSIRTVDNHLQRAYTKLGVRSRDELPAALELVPPPN